MPHCIVCGKEIGSFFVCETDRPVPVRMVEKNYCNTCGKERTETPRKFTQCPECYQKRMESEARERESRIQLRVSKGG